MMLAALPQNIPVAAMLAFLRRNVFLSMMGLALLVHVFALALLGGLPTPQAEDAPVRSMQFQIADSDRVIAEPASAVESVMPPPELPLADTSETSPELPPPPAMMPARTPETKVLSKPPMAQPAVTAADLFDSEVAAQESARQAIRAKYEQQISGWIQRHHFYPPEASGVQGRAVVRMRIDRDGYIRYFALEETSGNAVLDRAALTMLRRANPVPAAPLDYPAGEQIEFLVPITFKVPV